MNGDNFVVLVDSAYRRGINVMEIVTAEMGVMKNNAQLQVHPNKFVVKFSQL